MSSIGLGVLGGFSAVLCSGGWDVWACCIMKVVVGVGVSCGVGFGSGVGWVWVGFMNAVVGCVDLLALLWVVVWCGFWLGWGNVVKVCLALLMFAWVVDESGG